MFAQLFGNSVEWTPAALGPVAWYKAENNALDSAGANNGTWSGTEAYAVGTVGNAFSFNGASTITSIPATIDDSADFTICAWIKWTSGASIPSGGGYSIYNGGLGATGSGYVWRKTTETVTEIIGHTSAGARVTVSVTDGGNVCHVAQVVTGSRMLVYANGQLVSDLACPGFAGATQGRIGGDPGLNRRWSGTIDDVLCVDRSLTATEVKKLYDASLLKSGAAW